MDDKALQGFMEGLDRFGFDLDLWPPAARIEAAMLLASSPAARHALEIAQGAHRTLKSDADVKAPAGLSARIIAAATPDSHVSRRRK